jgi:hypothetical protein
MARTIKLKISARGVTDSPTVADLLGQLKDYFDLLEDVEEAISEDGRHAIDWRITGASKQSPLTLEATPFPKEFGVDIERRSEFVTRHTAFGLAELFERGKRPAYFNDRVLRRAEKIFERVTNGLDETIIDHGHGLPVLDLTPSVARRAIANTRNVLTPTSSPYRELGSIEGNVQRVERDGHGRRIVYVRYRLTGDIVKCLVSGEAEREIENHQIKDVWRYRRVQIYGTLYYRGIGELKEIEAIRVRFLRDRDELPSANDILDPDFTDGMSTEEYLARLRDGN